MIRSLPDAELQTALFARLDTDVDTSTYDIYDAHSVPLDPTFPYVTLQIVESVGDDAKNTVAHEVVFAVKAHTRTEMGEGGMAEVFTMADNLMQAITRTPIALVGDHTMIVERAQTTTPFSYLSGAHTHRDAAITGRYRVQYTP